VAGHSRLARLPAGPAGEDRRRAADRYARLVASAPDASLWDSALRQQIYLGDEGFVERMQALAEPCNSTDHDIPRVQRRKSRTLAQWLASCEEREEALYRAHTESALSMSAIARELGLSVSRVSRLTARGEGKRRGLTTRIARIGEGKRQGLTLRMLLPPDAPDVLSWRGADVPICR